jgi:hypothetical protein
MNVVEKRVITNIVFTQEEKDLLINLSDIVFKECGNHDTCETCPFDVLMSTCRGATCEDVANWLDAIARHGLEE